MSDIEQNLYEKIKQDLCRKIFNGIYEEGDRIPAERILSQELGISRVTLRKSLQLLEEEQIISRVQGSGTKVSLHYGARSGRMDIITVVASAQNEFFSEFLCEFERQADFRNCLVLYKQKPPGVSIEDCLFQLYEKNIRNVVLWTENMRLRPEKMKILKGLGLNIVLFDSVMKTNYADSVCLDNQDAIARLNQCLQEAGCDKVGYIGWNQMEIGSIKEREAVFRMVHPMGSVQHLSYIYHNCLSQVPEEQIREILNQIAACDGVIYAVGELGLAFESYARKYKMHHRAAMIGVLPGGEELGIEMIAQDFEEMSKEILDCLQKQNTKDSCWQPKQYEIKGRKKERVVH
jgi:DNA-binding transcriptional regulator YhcF (GntR family)